MTEALILGAGVWSDGPSPTLVRRSRHAAALFHTGHVTALIACGGLGRHPPTEAEAIRSLLLAEGVPDAAITLEERSTTTGENIRFALPLLAGREVLIVTDWYHAPRARLIARRVGLHATSSAPPRPGARPLVQAKGLIREIPAYLAYLFHIKS